MNQKELEGALFLNQRKENHKQPDFSGSIVIGGQMYWLSAWENTCGQHTSRPGQKFFKIKAQKAEERRPEPTQRQPEVLDDVAEDIPY